MMYRPTWLAGANVAIQFARGLLPLQSNAAKTHAHQAAHDRTDQNTAQKETHPE